MGFVSINERLPLSPNPWVVVTNGIDKYAMGSWDEKKWTIKNFSSFGLPTNEFTLITMRSDEITHWFDIESNMGRQD